MDYTIPEELQENGIRVGPRQGFDMQLNSRDIVL
jgi:hypothetical protein